MYERLKPYLETLEGKPMGTLLKNWKTTLAGIIGIVVVLGTSMGWLTHDQATMIGALAASFGLMAATDAKALKIIVFVAFYFGMAMHAGAQQPPPDTVLSTGVISNFSAAYHPAPYVAAGTLVTTGPLPIYAGMRYELYVDDAGKPAYAGLAFAKVIIYHKNRYFCFADSSVGGAASATSISSALQAGGACGMQIGKYSASDAPHWEIFAEPQARRIPALDNGTHKALLIGIAYSFNRPK